MIFDYFGGQRIIGNLAQADYCPLFQTNLVGRTCADTASVTLPYSNRNVRLEYFGASSRCLESNIQMKSSRIIPLGQAFPGCYKVVCSSDLQSYAVYLQNYSDRLGTAAVFLGECRDTKSPSLSGDEFLGMVSCAPVAELCQVPMRPRHVQGGEGGKEGGMRGEGDRIFWFILCGCAFVFAMCALTASCVFFRNRAKSRRVMSGQGRAIELQRAPAAPLLPNFPLAGRPPETSRTATQLFSSPRPPPVPPFAAPWAMSSSSHPPSSMSSPRPFYPSGAAGLGRRA